MFDVNRVRRDFPILEREINGRQLIYFDNTATTHKPIQVIDAVSGFYRMHNANVHRGLHLLSQEASELYEEAHDTVASFISAQDREEIVFVKNATEAINAVAFSWGLRSLESGDEIVCTVMEHHSNLLPWQFLEEFKGIRLKFIDLRPDGTLNLDGLNEVITRKTRLVAVTHVSNVIGTINDVKAIGEIVHDRGGLILVDAAQSVPHMPVNVKDLDCDFMAFSAHKMLGPTGIGVLYGKKDVLNSLSPYQFGGGMIHEVSLHKSTYSVPPWRFEAGTPNVAGAVGFAAAIRYLDEIGMKNVREHEEKLTSYCLKEMLEMEGVSVYGPRDPERIVGVISFNVEGFNHHDVASILDENGIAVRSGHHCAQPLVKRLGVRGTVRASFYIYNTIDEIKRFLDVLRSITGSG